MSRKFKHPKVIETKLGQRMADGIYEEDKNTIYVDERLRGVNKLDTYIHEKLHHIFPNLEEKYVARASSELADFLWQHHVRFVDNIK